MPQSSVDPPLDSDFPGSDSPLQCMGWESADLNDNSLTAELDFYS